MKRQFLSYLTVLVLICSGCSDRNTPDHVAEDFVYNYYRHADQQLAVALTDGLAREKLTDEIERLRGMRSASDQQRVQPQIEYEQVGKKPDGDSRVFFRYRLTIKNTSISSTIRNSVILTEFIDGRWKVVNFDEYAE